MDPTATLIEYIGFVVAALIIIWAVIELGRRMYAKKNFDPGSPDTWAKLNSIHPPAHEESLSDVDDRRR